MKNLKYNFLLLLILSFIIACSNEPNETQPLEVESGLIDLPVGGFCDPNDSTPPHFNVSLSLGNIFWQDGMEVGQISVGTNMALDCDLEVEMNYWGRKKATGYNPPYIPWKPLIPIDPSITINQGQTLSSFTPIRADYYGPCYPKTEYQLTITAVRYNGYVLDPSNYTIISGNNVKATLEYPTATNSCSTYHQGLLPCDCINFPISSTQCDQAIASNQGPCNGGVTIPGGPSINP